MATRGKCLLLVSKIQARNLVVRSKWRRLSTTSTVDPNEISNFNNLSSQWWDENGEFKPLHSMNTLRVPLIRNGLINSGMLPREVSTKLLSLSGVKILDVGCGGGILSEPLARIGANVVGLDASSEGVSIAKEHASRDLELQPRLTYIHGSLEDLAETDKCGFDVVVASEVIEHMTSAQQCVKLCSQLVKPGGSVFITTMNRTSLSWFAGVMLAERVLHIVPPDTHDWNKFVTPQEIRNMMHDNGLSVRLVHGMMYNPVNNTWCWSKNTLINYAIHAVKSK